jgi:glycogen debranching enzyme
MNTSTGSDHATTIRNAYRIAVRDLRSCYNPDGIVAGRQQFNAYWARDGFWATLGANALGDYDQTLTQIGLFVRFQRSNGCIPVRVEFIGKNFAGYRKLLARPRVVGRAGGLFADPIDLSSLFVIAAARYFEETRDVVFAERVESAVDLALRWLRGLDRDRDGLIESHLLADWMDSILKTNQLLTLNVLYWAALRGGETIKRGLQAGSAADQYGELAGQTHASLQSVFWNGDYFVDWVHGTHRGAFASDGNIFAMQLGLATPEQASRIIAFVARQGLQRDAPLRTCNPVYPWWRVFPAYYLAGIPDYHRTLIWPWQGTLFALCKDRAGDRAGALADLAQIGEWYIRWHSVSEVYTPDGRPLARRFYTADVPFAWNAGTYVYAVHALGMGSRKPRDAGAAPVL